MSNFVFSKWCRTPRSAFCRGKLAINLPPFILHLSSIHCVLGAEQEAAFIKWLRSNSASYRLCPLVDRRERRRRLNKQRLGHMLQLFPTNERMTRRRVESQVEQIWVPNANTNGSVVFHHRRRIIRPGKRGIGFEWNKSTPPMSKHEIQTYPPPLPLIVSNEFISDYDAHKESRASRGWLDLQTSTHTGSPPTDYFGLLPVKGGGDVPMAFDFFALVYAPLKAKSSIQQQMEASGFQMCVQVLLQDPMLFEQYMAYSHTMQSLHRDISTRMTTPVLYHSSKSVTQLPERMNSDNNNCDGVIMTIVVLAKLFLTCGQYETAGVHVNALRRIVSAARWVLVPWLERIRRTES
jgi:hypothetical protein